MQCKPYHVGNKALIIGDAAHAMVPFYAMGMNTVSRLYWPYKDNILIALENYWYIANTYFLYRNWKIIYDQYIINILSVYDPVY